MLYPENNLYTIGWSSFVTFINSFSCVPYLTWYDFTQAFAFGCPCVTTPTTVWIEPKSICNQSPSSSIIVSNYFCNYYLLYNFSQGRSSNHPPSLTPDWYGMSNRANLGRLELRLLKWLLAENAPLGSRFAELIPPPSPHSLTK